MKKESQIAANYLSEYSDTVEALPLELQRNYTLIRQLDENAEDLMQQVATQAKYLSTTTTPITMEERRAKLELIGQLLNESLKKGEEKFALAKSTYDTVDRHCTRLDNDLQKIEDEQLVGPGRISSNNTQHIDTKPTHSTMKKRHADDLIITGQQPKSQHQVVVGRGRKKMKKEGELQRVVYLSTKNAIQHAKAAVSQSDLPIDPNEPLYCYCTQVSFGEMVACDNDECEIEWFHLECVGLQTPPKGKWFCNNCIKDLKKKKKL